MKRKHSIYTVFVLLILAAFVLPACSGLAQSNKTDCPTAETFCIGLVTEAGKLNDHSLNQLAWEALQRAELRLDASIDYIETVDSRDYEKNIITFAQARYDLVVTVGYGQRKATIDIAKRYPSVSFIGVDQPLEPDKSLPGNLVGLSFPEDKAGFLAGALAGQMSKTRKIGAVCGPDTFPPAWRYCEGFKAGAAYIALPPVDTTSEEPTDEEPFDEEPPLDEEPTDEEPTDEEEGEEEQFARNRSVKKPAQQEPTPEPTEEEVVPVEVIVIYHNEVAFSDSIADPEWDAETAQLLIDGGADVIFGADSFGENAAASAAARRSVYAIGVHTDQFLLLPDAQDMLLSSAVKRITGSLFDLIKAAMDGELPRGNFTGEVGYAPYQNLSSRVPDAVKQRMIEIEEGLNDGSIETDVPAEKPSE